MKLERLLLRDCIVGKLIALTIAVAALGDGGLACAQSGGEIWQWSGVTFDGSLPASISGIIMPEVVALPDGSYRMYFGAQRAADAGMDIWYADSPDATSFAIRGVALAGTSDPCDPEFTVTGASLVHLPDGRWRMYYQARQVMGQCSPQIQFQTYSAISSDGIMFAREGVRLAAHSQDPSSPLGGAPHGRVLLLDNGTFVAILGANLAPPSTATGLFLLTSADGLNFGPPQQLPAPSNSHDPYVVKVGGRYVLYADVSPPATTSALMLTSPDGLNWSAGSSATFYNAFAAPLVFPPNGDIGGVVLADGTLRLFSDFGRNFARYERFVPGGPTANPAIAVEYYYAAWNFYFVTSSLTEIAVLDGGAFGGAWQRTGKTFNVWSQAVSGSSPTCRFFSTPTAFGGKSSHFYTPFPVECQNLQTDPALSSVWQLETAAAFYVALTDAFGNCPIGLDPLYRAYDNGMGGAPNHRYTTDPAIQASMISRGWVAEGSGPDIIFACVPPPTLVPAHLQGR